MIRPFLAIVAIALAAPAAIAQIPGFDAMIQPEAPRDPRIRVIDYDTDQIFSVTGHTGYQMTIEFEPGEKIETVGIGDSSGWQVTPNGNATLLFVKPMAVVPTTNMTLVTNKRHYNLELISRNGARVNRDAITYVLRFRLPPPPPAIARNEDLVTPIPEAMWNRNYRFEGSKELVPEEIFDDGSYTFIRFADTMETPAIFAVSGAEDENLVNSNQRGKYVMIDRVSGQIVLRHGKLVTRLFNEAYVSPEPGPNAPKPRPRKKRGFLGLGG
ncbi:MAG: TrbG/VirB9 family P-type conjugative transfer protein [Sphingorhabdus sp.]